jgi:hypothetical protein
MPSTDNVPLTTISPGDIIYVPSHVIGWKVIAETSGSVPVGKKLPEDFIDHTQNVPQINKKRKKRSNKNISMLLS